MSPQYNPYLRQRFSDPHRGYGRSQYGGNDDGGNVLAQIAQLIEQRRQERQQQQPVQAATEDEVMSGFMRGAPVPREALTPMGRFNSMGMERRAQYANAGIAGQSVFKERQALKSIMEDIRRTTNESGQQVAIMPDGATITDEIGTPKPMGWDVPTMGQQYPFPTEEEFKARGQSAFAPVEIPGPPNAQLLAGPPANIPVTRRLDSRYGTGSATFAGDVPTVINGMAGDEWFQRAANAGNANSFATAEPGYAGNPEYDAKKKADEKAALIAQFLAKNKAPALNPRFTK